MEVVVYTDASVCPTTKYAACGFIALRGTKSIKHEITLMSSIWSSKCAEYKAVSFALQYCFLLNGVKEIILYTEMDHIVNWSFTEKQKRYYPYIQEIVDVCEIIREHGVEIKFMYVKAHSHNRYNDIVDKSVLKALRDFLKQRQLRWQQKQKNLAK